MATQPSSKIHSRIQANFSLFKSRLAARLSRKLDVIIIKDFSIDFFLIFRSSRGRPLVTIHQTASVNGALLLPGCYFYRRLIFFVYDCDSMTIRLPCPESLRWSHSTNSLKRLEKALDDEQINAIEADILMGQCTEESIICEGSLNQAGTTQSCDIVPIMAHPPNRSSCLSLQSFLNLALKPSSKHIKLDMKELRAVSATLACLLARIENCKLERDSTQQSTTIFLNADIFPGPGCRDSLECVEATSFVVECKEFRGKAKGLKNATSFDLALSLGFKVDYREKEGYTEEDCKKVSDLVRNYYLEDEFGKLLFS